MAGQRLLVYPQQGAGGGAGINVADWGSNARWISPTGDNTTGASPKKAYNNPQDAYDSLTNGRGVALYDPGYLYQITTTPPPNQPALRVPQGVHSAPAGFGRFGGLGTGPPPVSTQTGIKEAVCIEYAGGALVGKKQPVVAFGFTNATEWASDTDNPASSGGGSWVGLWTRLAATSQADYLFEQMVPQNNVYIGHARFGNGHKYPNPGGGSAAISQFFIRAPLAASPPGGPGAAQYDNLRIQGGLYPLRIGAGGNDGMLWNNLCMDVDDASLCEILLECSEINANPGGSWCDGKPNPVTNMVKTGGGPWTVTVSVANTIDSGVVNNQWVWIGAAQSIAAAAPAPFNGLKQATIISANSFSFTTTVDPGTWSSGGVCVFTNTGNNGSATITFASGQNESPAYSGLPGGLSGNGMCHGIWVTDDVAMLNLGMPLWAGSNNGTGSAIRYSAPLTGVKLPRVWTVGVMHMGFANAWQADMLALAGDTALIPSVQGGWRSMEDLEPRRFRRVVKGSTRQTGSDSDWPTGFCYDGMNGGYLTVDTDTGRRFFTYRESGVWVSMEMAP